MSEVPTNPDTDPVEDQPEKGAGKPFAELSLEEQNEILFKRNRQLESVVKGKSQDRAQDVPRLTKERDALAKELESIKQSQMSEQEKILARAEAAEKELERTRADSIRASVALERGLTPSQAKRLVGATREELEADADELLEDLKASKPGTAPSSDGQGKQGEPVGDAKQITSRDQLKSMSREEQLAAYRDGRLKGLTG